MYFCVLKYTIYGTRYTKFSCIVYKNQLSDMYSTSTFHILIMQDRINTKHTYCILYWYLGMYDNCCMKSIIL